MIALSDSTKLSSLSQEVVRRLLNTSRRLEDTVRMETLETFSQKMRNSGHTMGYIEKALLSGITNYERKVNNSNLPRTHHPYKPLHMDSNYKAVGRWKKKVMAKETWYKDKKNDQKKSGSQMKKTFQKAGLKRNSAGIPTSTVIFIPSSKGSKLLKLMKENEDKMSELTGFRIRMMEAGGIKLRNMFSTDLAKGSHCGSQSCQPCGRITENRENCKRRNIVYESICEICNQGKTSNLEEADQERTGDTTTTKSTSRKGVYIGETSRTLHERANEHFRDARDFSEKSHMVKHWLSSHQEDKEVPGFRFRITGTFKDCLSRQINEAMKIFLSEDEMLNSKNEYLANCLTRVQVSEDRFERKMRELREDDEEKEYQAKVAKLKFERTSWAEGKRDDQDDDQPSGRSILELMKMKRKPAEKAGPAEKRRKVNPTDTDINIKLFLEVAEGMCLRVGQLKTMLKHDLQRMERRWACWKMDEIVMDTPSWWNRMGDQELQQAVHDVDEVEQHPPPCQEASSRSPPPSNTNEESRQAGTTSPTIRKIAEGWRKEKDEKAESNKRMEISWNMVGLVGWWRRVERENLKQIKDEEKKQEI